MNRKSTFASLLVHFIECVLTISLIFHAFRFTGEMKYHIHFDNPLPDDSDQPPQSSTASVAQAPAIGSVLVNNFICQICDIE